MFKVNNKDTRKNIPLFLVLTLNMFLTYIAFFYFFYLLTFN